MRRYAVIFGLALAFMNVGTASAAWLDNALGILQHQIGSGESSSPSEHEVVAGLKQALGKGVRLAVSSLGRINGFWMRPGIEIPLPQSLQKPAAFLRRVGFGEYAEDLHKRINRAAEAAVPVARPIFREAIASMRFSDARKILRGPDDAATRYFEKKTMAKLRRAFTPLVHRELNREGAIRSYRKFSSRYASLPLVGEHLKDNLDDYVTRRALAAMFKMLAMEEKNIRHNPTARTTALLKRVFAN